MRVARLHAPGDLRLADEPRPTPSGGDALLRVTGVGLCGSDRHWFEDGSIGGASIERPLVLGHEFVGVVLGGDRADERVVADPAVPCGTCTTCARGRVELCPTAGFAGYPGTDGALRRYATWPSSQLLTLPSGIDDDEGTLLEPLGIALHAVHLAEVTPSSTVAVVGAGPIGQLVIRTLRAEGVRDVAVAEPLAHRLDLAVASGARPLRVDDEVDVAIEVAGEDAAVDLAIARARPGGRVVLVGIPGDDRTTFTASVARRKGLTLQLCRRMRPRDLARAIELVEARRIPLDGLISHVFDLDDVDDAFRTLVRRDGHKVVVRP
jgi:L-iditol 2-dehydrogenase